jgi:Beta-lactamase superfamily domain
MKYTNEIMVISYQGAQSFKVSFGDTTLAFNPVAKDSKFETVKYGADAAFVTLYHPDFNGVEQVSHGSKQPFVVDGPGEYEIGQATARGFGVKTNYKGKEYFNTIYQVHLEDINMIFLGAIDNPEIDPKILSELGDIDILFLPIGGGDLLEVPQASKLAVKLEAKLVIPMHYDAVSLKTFLKEESKEDLKPVEKITLKKKDIYEMEGEVIVLKA